MYPTLPVYRLKPYSQIAKRPSENSTAPAHIMPDLVLARSTQPPIDIRIPDAAAFFISVNI